MIKFSTGKKSTPGRSSGLRIFLWAGLLLTGILVCFGIYSMARLTAARISADYYFPFLKILQHTEDTIANQALLTQSKSTLARALRKLMDENAMLAADRTVVSDLKKENEELRSLLNIGRRDSFRPVFAEVLRRDPMTWQEQFTIDKGSRAGIELGNLVVTSIFSERKDAPPIAVIGKVTSVTGHTAVVSTVLSQDFRLSVSLPATKSSGVLEGAHHLSDMYAVLKFLPLNAAPTPGQLVYTNSFSGNCPPGMPLGIIVSTSGASQNSHRNQLYLETFVRPFASPAEVRFAAVFVREKK